MYYNEYETRERMLIDLWSNLMMMVESGDITDIQAMKWYNDKADQWSQGL